LDGNLSCSEGLLSVEAMEVQPEDLVKELGEECDIKIVLYGEVFSELPISIKFYDLPLRQGIERVLRVAKIKNYLMHFEHIEEEKDRIVEIDLIGKKGGERELTSGLASKGRSRAPDESTQVKTEIEDDSQKEEKEEEGKVFESKLKKEDAQKIQESFLDIMDQILEQQFEEGEEPDPAAILKLFKDVVPQEMEKHIPPEFLEELEKLSEE
jgi:hypothetical protein